MAHGAPAPSPYTTERYLALVDEGVLGPDDRVELLEGVIVAMSPPNPRPASGTTRVEHALRPVLGFDAVIRVQQPLVAGRRSVPEPDVAVVPGGVADYDVAHPRAALLVVEVADTSLVQDRLTKAPIYARAGVPECWIANLRDDVVEVHRKPDRVGRRYMERVLSRRGERIALAACPGATVAVDDLLPGR